MSADTALIVIDVQESFRQRSYWNEAEAQPFIANVQRLIDGAKAKGLPVVQIFHVDGDGPFALDSGFVKPLAPVSLSADVVFHKARHSALVGSGLEVWLNQNNIRKVLIAGIRTEQCCETTTRHASDLGYDVDYVSEATLTFAMTNAEGRTFSAEEIKARTELVLAGRFAKIVTVDEALSGVERAMAA
ncbi:isochorismatase family protein [Phyllobacterium sp. YR531]|uniref:isochorismatase family protein n=1 Tax=Phyllobacterium sp. YR531 TaxID=1144343 RepID=UPI00026F6CBF|nr:isochorismatase family protein [Phyllobacterium sp. YR531]EJN04561.1 nicotinamidase-like amidase [Phyllobacterium sp. YR531]